MSVNVPVRCLFTEMRPIDSLVANPKNPNGHPADQIEKLGKIIVAAGWRSPIVVSSRSGMIVKGHGRFEAARMAGLTEVPVEIQSYESEAAELADLVADNRLAELSESDNFAIHGVLEELNASGAEMLTMAGFTTEEFGKLNAEIEKGLEAPKLKLRTSRESNNGLSDTTFKAGPVRFPVKREDFLRWQSELRASVGFEKRPILKEIKRRLGMTSAAKT